MKLDNVKYAVCQNCGRRYPLAHCIIGTKTGSGETRPDKYIAHKNVDCVPCIRNEKKRIDAREKRRDLTCDEIDRRKVLIDALPDVV